MIGLKRWPGLSLVMGAACLLVCQVASADSLDRARQDDAQAADGLVHCLFPGQVRRLGAFATSVTPRRAARVAPKDCAAGGGEYIEPQDTSSAASKIWLPLAADGVPEAQATVAELYERQGQPGLAKAWYEKAAAQGMARAQFGLAAMLDKGLGGGRNAARVAELLAAAGGGLVAGLTYQPREQPHVDFVAPDAAAPIPRAVGGRVALEAAPGPVNVVARVVAPAGLASVKVNGQTQQPDAQGFVTVPVTVGESPASVIVEAQDRDGVLAQAQLTMVQRSPAPSAKAVDTRLLEPGLLKGRRLALVVANQAYQHWPKLETPQADAQAVSDALRQRFGFDVTMLQNATRQQLLAALNRLRMQAGPEDQVVVYYAGHGQMDQVTARGYWIPVDGDQQDLAQWVSVIDVTDQLAAMSARHVMVIADSCYSGTLTRSLLPQIDQALSSEQRQLPLGHLVKQRVRVAMTSGGLEPVVDGGSVDHSLFVRSLLDMLDQVRAPVSAQELFAGVSSRFAYLAQRLHIAQQPQYAPIGFAGHEAGDFVLAPI
ncbi:MAG: hypothetical protein EPO09_14500 [Aquabacterium sp.]|uniref:caspase family protein n=1 Tax=Aquabacterium sp. TaxID=1872578 RepID=UPI00120C72D8|nr:caspase family protein [Aquabacterium sp.]TAK92836.1 MAG: hypothetical protein EPO09_14500 [Aquabacterium sp.]